ncbi:MAG: ferredoxin reductase family protein [Lentisphaeria bacterium]|nr:ferredoxin reductase family protein [Lentisphaeria bacterium]
MSCKRGSVFLAGGYLVLIALLLAVFFLGVTWDPPPLRRVAYGAGCVAYVLFSCQLLLSARLRWLDRWVSLDRLYVLHGVLAAVALVVVYTHGILVTWGHEGESSLKEAGEIARLLFVLATVGGAVLLGTVWLERIPGYAGLRQGIRRVFHLRYHWCVWLHNVAVVGVTVMLVHILLLSPPTLLPFKVVCVLLYACCVGTHLYHRLLRQRFLPAWRCQEAIAVDGAVHTLRFRPGSGGGMQSEAGQFAYLSLGLPGLREPHPFTIAGNRDGEIEFDIKASGDWTRELAAVGEGSEARLHGPFGAFTLEDVEPACPLLLVAGGIGITPFLAMVRELAATGSSRDVRLVWSVGAAPDAFARDELDGLASRLPGLQVTVWVTHGPGGKGWLDAAAFATLLDAADLEWTEVFLCGPPEFMTAMTRTLLGMGLPAARLHAERFGY